MLDNEKSISKTYNHWNVSANFESGINSYRKKEFKSAEKSFKKANSYSNYDWKSDLNIKLSTALSRTKKMIKSESS